MKLAMVAGGFCSEEADRLRRILSHKRAEQLMGPYQDRFISGCVSRGYPRAFAEQCFKQFRGFAHYGFPESHSASFAIIAYASAYLKRYYPAAFCAALLNSQPMGFYAAHTIVEDARRHGVAQWYDDGARLIGDPEVDAVYVATPPDATAAYAGLAARAGTPVGVETPMARTYEAWRRVIGAWRSAGRPLNRAGLSVT